MKAACPKCKTQFNVDESKIPESGAHAKCPHCRHRVLIKIKTPPAANKTPKKKPAPKPRPAPPPTESAGDSDEETISLLDEAADPLPGAQEKKDVRSAPQPAPGAARTKGPGQAGPAAKSGRKAKPDLVLPHPGRKEELEEDLPDRQWCRVCGGAFRLGLDQCPHCGTKVSEADKYVGVKKNHVRIAYLAILAIFVACALWVYFAQMKNQDLVKQNIELHKKLQRTELKIKQEVEKARQKDMQQIQILRQQLGRVRPPE